MNGPVCIIGAGASGLAAARALDRCGISFDCFEKSDRSGGMWVFDNSISKSAAYRSLHLNSSRQRSGYSEFPMPQCLPDFPHHSDVAEYLMDYAKHFGLLSRISFKTEVISAETNVDGSWKIHLKGREMRYYKALIVATGHHWKPNWPEPAFPGVFNGTQIHARDYIDPTDFAGKHVVVVGMGNSAMDIASECGTVAERTYLVARRGAYVIPKYLMGRTLDDFPIKPWIPWKIRQFVLSALLRMQVGRPELYGLPRPLHGPAQAHPTVSSEILTRIGHGQVTPKPNISILAGDNVVFTDSTQVRADVIVYCTGYKVCFPFFSSQLEDQIGYSAGKCSLFHNVASPNVKNLFLIGLIQPLGAVFPLVEVQSKWVAAWLAGEYKPPSIEMMRSQIERSESYRARRYVNSPRHQFEVDAPEYAYEVTVELRRGQRRVRL